MPFTFAHPLAVLPLLRSRYFSATGLLVGSIVPDFEYFFKMRSGSEHSHTLAGIFYFDLPLSFFLAIIFHQVIKVSLIENLPASFQQRLHALKATDFLLYLKTNLWVFVFSCLFGAGTHLLWDSFTHGGGVMVKEMTILNTTRIYYDGVYYPLWYSLQHGFSVAGLILLSYYFYQLKPSEVYAEKPSYGYLIIVLIVSAVTFYLRYRLGANMNFGNTIVAIVSALLFGILTASVLFNFKRAKKHR